MNSHIGIDISYNDIRIVELSQNNDKLQLISAGSAKLPRLIDVSVQTDDVIFYLTNALRNLMKETNIKGTDISISLPETQVFTRVVKIPKVTSKELLSAIRWEAEQYIPMPLTEVNIDYAVTREQIPEEPTMMELYLVAAPKNILKTYTKIFDTLDYNLTSIETDSTAIYRTVSSMYANLSRYMVVHIGTNYSSVIIIDGSIAYVHTVGSGVESFVRTISQYLNIDMMQASQYLKVYGFDKNKIEGKLYIACQSLLTSLLNEIKKALVYYEETHPASKIQTILMSGIGAHIPNSIVLITESMGIEAQIINPWNYIQKDPIFSRLDAESGNYVIPIGLSLR